MCVSLSMGGAVYAAPDLTADAAFVTDVKTGDCYYELNADAPLAPASMTKVMTVYIVYRNRRST